jgi:hypothetical protein
VSYATSVLEADTKYKPEAPDPRILAVPDSLLLPEVGGDIVSESLVDEKGDR